MKVSNSLLIIFVFSFFTSGVIDTFAPAWIDAVLTIHAFSIAIILFCWVGEHAKEQGIEPPLGSRILSAFIPPIGLPYYFYRGFGFVVGTAKIILGVGLLLISIALSIIPSYAVEALFV